MTLVTLAAHRAESQTVTPKGTAVTTAPNTGAATYAFTVKNPTTTSALYNITVGCSGYVTSCSESSGGEVSLAAGRSTTVTATYSTGTSGTGQVTLTAQNEATLASNQGYINVAPPTTATPVVTADNTTWYTDQNASTNYPSFHVQNTGNTAATYTLSVACSNIPSCSVRANPGQIAPGASANVIIDYTSGPASGGSGTMTLTATSPYSETANRSLTIVPLSDSVTVTPKGGAVTLNRGASSSVNFTVSDVGNSSPVTYTLTCGYSGTVTSCSTPDTVRVSAGTPQTVPVSYSVSSSLAGGAGSITLTASINTGFHLYSDQGSYSGTVPDARTYWVAVTPDGGSATAEANASGRSFTFQVKNTGNSSGTYNLSVTQCAGATSSCSLGSSTVAIDPAQTVSVPVSFSTGGVGQPITLNLQAVDGTYNDIGSVTVQPVTYSDSVAALDATPSTPAGATGTYHFSVTNTGTADSTTYSLQVAACNAPVINCSAPASVTVARGATKTVAVSYSTQATPGSGSITLRAYLQMANLYQSSATGSIAVTSAAPLIVDLSPANFGKTVTRDRCLTISLGRGAAYECGDLRLVHALPTVRTMNTARTPVLLYTSQHASPRPIIVADVTLPSVDPLPTTVQATVSVAGNPAVTGSASWNGADWGAPGARRRVGVALDASALPTGAYPYTLTVTTQGSAGSKTQTAQDTLIVVNRASSSFGTGWWLAGVEQLVKPAMDTTMRLWIGGDGSARLYHKIAGSVWTAPAVDGLDSLTWDPSLDRYTRWDLHRLRTIFDGSGTHIQTVNRTQDTTRFTWSGGQLQTIAVPTPSSSIAYSFGYTGGSLTSVTSPDGRLTSVARSGSTLTLTDPDLTTVQFAYGSANAIMSRTDRRGNVVTYGYDAAGRVDSVAANMGASPAVVTVIRPAESQPTAATAQIPDSVYTLVNGPRRDTTITRVWIDRFGEPTKFVDALNGATTLERADSRFPALVTRMTGPTGFVMTASYDGHGNLQTSVAVNPLEDGVSDTTRYTWEPTFDFPTSIVNPMHDSTVMSYDPATGNQLWRQPGNDQSRRVSFVYNDHGQVIADSLPSYLGRFADATTYDPVLGNVQSSRTPKGFVTSYYMDAAGRDTLVKSPIDSLQTNFSTTHVWYDLQGRDTLSIATGHTETGLVAADTMTTRTVHDPEGNVVTVAMRSGPDINALGWVTHNYSFDALGRKITENTAGYDQQTFSYDAAGNRTNGGISGGRALVNQYDPLNRLVRRTSSQDTATFTYDPAGRLIEADNRFAEVSRHYYAGGAVRSDTLRIARTDTTITGAARFSSNVYGLTYDYDANGRRVALHRQGFAGSMTPQSYRYDPVTGELASITDSYGSTFTYAYDAAGNPYQTTTIIGADTVQQTHIVDPDGRLLNDQASAWTAGQTTTIRNDALQYDGRGKVLADVRNVPNETPDQFTYAGLGAAATSDIGLGDTYSETFAMDAFGNRHEYTLTGGAVDSPVDETDQYRAGYGTQLQRIVPVGQGRSDTTSMSYAEGRLTETYLLHVVQVDGWNSDGSFSPGLKIRSVRENFYQPDGLMSESHFAEDSVPAGIGFHPYTADEQYRYDALGRRVWRRLVFSSNCRNKSTGLAAGCHNGITRFIWDGDQLLYETRVQTDSTNSLAGVDNDDNGGTWSTHYGLVSYVHGIGGIDQPLVVYRGSNSAGVVPLYNYRGSPTHAACGAIACTSTNLYLPAMSEGLYGGPRPRNGPSGWSGSLLEEHTDGSGYRYMRNRYMDPATGSFTQADPLGLAGGSNAWGFANGDPVNYADPFGLCGEKDGNPCPSKLLGALQQLGQMAPSMNRAVITFLPKNAATAVGGLAAEGAIGAVLGRLTSKAVVHFTSEEGAAAIESSGALRSGSFVAVPGEVAGRSAAEVENLLEIQPGRGAMSARFRVSADALKTPFNGPTTSGGATQFQLTRPVPVKPGTFVPNLQ